jgi:hypothetical protein
MNSKTTTTAATMTVISGAAKDALKAEFIKAAQGYLSAFTTFTSAVQKALAMGVDIKEIKAWGEEAGLTPQGINKALRTAGVRQRGIRSDFGISKMGVPSINVRGAAKPDSDEDGDEKDGEGDGGESTSEDTKTPGGLAAYILRICGGDKGKATQLAIDAITIIRQ